MQTRNLKMLLSTQFRQLTTYWRKTLPQKKKLFQSLPKPSLLDRRHKKPSNSLFFVLLFGFGSLVVSMAIGFYRCLLGRGLRRWWLLLLRQWHLRLRSSQWRHSWRRWSGLLLLLWRAVLCLTTFRVRQLQNGNSTHIYTMTRCTYVSACMSLYMKQDSFLIYVILY